MKKKTQNFGGSQKRKLRIPMQVSFPKGQVNVLANAMENVGRPYAEACEDHEKKSSTT